MPAPTIPTIETERLILRGPVPADADVWVTFISEPDFGRYVPRSKVTRTPQERAERTISNYQQRWESQPLSAVGWAVTRKEDGQFIGLCGAEALEGANDGELDYFLGKPYWGRGSPPRRRAQWCAFASSTPHGIASLPLSYPLISHRTVCSTTSASSTRSMSTITN
jgi:RimJ/RimL family protein N-acetyltransferase